MMKKLMALLAVFSSIGCFAVTDVYFENDSGYTLKVQYTRGKKPDGDYKTYWTTIKPKPGDPYKLMMVPRGGLALDPSTKYYFNAVLSGIPGPQKIRIWLALQVSTSPIHGAGKTSAIKATAFLEINGKRMPYSWHTEDEIIKGIVTEQKIGGKRFLLGYKWKGLHPGSVYQDIEFYLKSTGTITPANELNLLQYNIQQRPGYSAVGTGSLDIARDTVDKMPAALLKFDPNIDVVTVNEAFSGVTRPILINNMKKIGFNYHTNVLNVNKKPIGGFDTLGGTVAKITGEGWSGGVMVFSKYPIKKVEEYMYKTAAEDDLGATKGVLYVQIDKMGKLYNIFATHTNASYTFTGKSRLPMNDKGRIARKTQLKEVKKFIDAQRIPSNQPVIMVGDMNVDMISEKGQKGDEYSYLLKTLNAIHPPISGHKYTLDKNTNSLVDPDDGPPQYLDYALYSKSHQRPTSAKNEPVCLKANGKNTCRKLGKKQEISDHYPLRAKFVFPK